MNKMGWSDTVNGKEWASQWGVLPYSGASFDFQAYFDANNNYSDKSWV